MDTNMRRRETLSLCVALLAGCMGGDNPAEDDSNAVTPAGTDGHTQSSSGTTTPSGSDSPTPTTSETVTRTELEFETRRVESNDPVIEGGIAANERSYYATLVTSESATDRFERSALNEETVTFVEEATLPEEPLLVVQYHLPSISLELTVESVTWGEDGPLRVRAVTTGEYLLEESITETVIARLSPADRLTPETAEVTLVDRHHEYEFRTSG